MTSIKLIRYAHSFQLPSKFSILQNHQPHFRLLQRKLTSYHLVVGEGSRTISTTASNTRSICISNPFMTDNVDKVSFLLLPQQHSQPQCPLFGLSKSPIRSAWANHQEGVEVIPCPALPLRPQYSFRILGGNGNVRSRGHYMLCLTRNI